MDTAVVSVRLPTTLVDALDRRAKVEGRPRANMLRLLVREALEQSDAKETRDA